jgi:hypothetical protein
MTFSGNQYSELAGLQMRSGMLDNANGQSIPSRIKGNIEQVKLIMSIMNDPDFKSATEQLAKLQMSGASTNGSVFSTAATTLRMLGMNASMSGTSVQHLMNTVGAQGQYLYQSNGMTPYLGQIAAAGAYSSFAAANRMGLTSAADLARMGGLEGATQASLTGQINVSQTMLNKMALFNSYLSGRGGTGAGVGGNMDMNQVIARFGQNMSQNPLETYGSFMLHGDQMAGNWLTERGTLSVDDQLKAIVKNMPGALDKNGKISLEKATPFLMQMGMSLDQIRAYGTQVANETNPRTVEEKLRGINRSYEEQTRQYISNSGTQGSIIGGAWAKVRKLGNRMIEGAAEDFVYPVTRATGSVGDWLSRKTDELNYGSTFGDSDNSKIDVLLGKVPDTSKTYSVKGATMFDFSPKSGGMFTDNALENRKMSSADQHHLDALKAVQDLATSGKAGSQEALAALSETDPQKRAEKLQKLLGSGVLGADYADRYNSLDGSKGFMEFAKSIKTVSGATYEERRHSWKYSGISAFFASDSTDPQQVNKAQQFTNELVAGSGMKTDDKTAQAHVIGLSAEIDSRIGKDAKEGGINVNNIDELMKTDKDLQQLSKLTGKSGRALLEAVVANVAQARKAGLVGFGIASLKYNGKNALEDTAKSLGGEVYGKKIGNALDLTEEENRGGIAADISAAKQKQIETDKAASDRILDVSKSQDIKNSLDIKDSVEKFDAAVDKFSKIMDKSKDAPQDGVSNGATQGSSGDQPGFLSRLMNSNMKLSK